MCGLRWWQCLDHTLASSCSPSPQPGMAEGPQTKSSGWKASRGFEVCGQEVRVVARLALPLLSGSLCLWLPLARVSCWAHLSQGLLTPTGRCTSFSPEVSSPHTPSIDLVTSSLSAVIIWSLRQPRPRHQRVPLGRTVTWVAITDMMAGIRYH